MKRTLAALLTGLSLVTALPSLAVARDHHRHDRDRHHNEWQRHDRGHGHHHHRSHSSAIGWGLAGVAVGGILFSMDAPSPPVVITPPLARPPNRMWYYCDAYAAYYPYVDHCPGGWRAVPAY